MPWTLGGSAVRRECYLQRSGVSCSLVVWAWCWLDPHSIQAPESPFHQQTWWTSAILCSPKTGTWTSLPVGSFERTQAPGGSCWALRRSWVSTGGHGTCSASFSMMGWNNERVWDTGCATKILLGLYPARIEWQFTKISVKLIYCISLTPLR